MMKNWHDCVCLRIPLPFAVCNTIVCNTIELVQQLPRFHHLSHLVSQGPIPQAPLSASFVADVSLQMGIWDGGVPLKICQIGLHSIMEQKELSWRLTCIIIEEIIWKVSLFLFWNKFYFFIFIYFSQATCIIIEEMIWKVSLFLFWNKFYLFFIYFLYIYFFSSNMYNYWRNDMKSFTFFILK